MSRDLQNRRNFLVAAVLGTTTIASGTQLFSLLNKAPHKNTLNPLRNSLRIGFSDWIPTYLAREIEMSYLRPMAQRAGRSLEIVKVANFSLLENLSFDAVVTSTSFHRTLSPEHAYFGAVPFGLTRQRKIDWLFSADGQRHQDLFFAQLGFKPQLIGMGSDQMGSFAKIKINSPEALLGSPKGISNSAHSIAISDLRATWFARLGLRVSRLHPAAQIEALKRGVLDISEPVSPVASFASLCASSGTHSDGSGESWIYNLFPKIRTAPTVFCLWRKPTSELLLADLKSEVESMGRTGFEKVSSTWVERESQALTQIGTNHSIFEIPSSVIDLFQADANRYHLLLARQSAFATSLAQAHLGAS